MVVFEHDIGETAISGRPVTRLRLDPADGARRRGWPSARSCSSSEAMSSDDGSCMRRIVPKRTHRDRRGRRGGSRPQDRAGPRTICCWPQPRSSGDGRLWTLQAPRLRPGRGNQGHCGQPTVAGVPRALRASEIPSALKELLAKKRRPPPSVSRSHFSRRKLEVSERRARERHRGAPQIAAVLLTRSAGSARRPSSARSPPSSTLCRGQAPSRGRRGRSRPSSARR